jgi:tripartite-type tricarboxylate transporter receptor subunit TctC
MKIPTMITKPRVYTTPSRISVVTLLLALGAGAAHGQDFPIKPIRIVTSAPGGSSDFTSRLIAQGLTDALGQPVVVDNRGNFGGEQLAKAPPDGYTLIVDGASLWIGPLIQKTSYDPLRDFAPVTIAVSAPNVIVVHPSLPVKSVKDLIALAKARPGELNYGSGGIGGASHLPAELFKSMAGINIVNVNYKGTGAAVNALLSGEIQMMFANAAISTPHIKSGRLRGVAAASLQPSPLLPDLPTVAASGLPGFESIILQGVLTAGNTPAARITRLNQEIVRALNRPDVKERHFNTGVETVGSTPETLAATMRSDIVKWGKVIQDAGIKNQ